MTMYFAVPPAEVMFASRVQGVDEQVAPLAENEWIVGVPEIVPAAHDAVPQVIAPVTIAPPPVSIGVTVGEPASA
jgi:hypothetical protein